MAWPSGLLARRLERRHRHDEDRVSRPAHALPATQAMLLARSTQQEAAGACDREPVHKAGQCDLRHLAQRGWRARLAAVGLKRDTLDQ